MARFFRIIISSVAALLSLMLFIWGIHRFSYTLLLILFLLTDMFFLHAVKLYGKMYPDKKKAVMKAYLWTVFIFYLIFLFLLTFRISRSTPRFILGDAEKLRNYLDTRCNFVPFSTISMLIRHRASFRTIMVNIVGNIIALAPLGFFLPALFRPLRKFIPFVFTTTMVVIFIESVQFVFNVGACDVDDLILNVAGAVIVFAVLKLTLFRKDRDVF